MSTGASAVPNEEAARTDYLIVMALLAHADGTVDPAEEQAVRDLAAEFGLQPSALARVLATWENPPEDMGPLLQRLSRSELRYSLLADLCSLAHVDGVLVTAEVNQVRQYAEHLGVPPGHADALLRFAGRLDRARRSFQGVTPEALLEIRQELVSSGVPLRAVALSGALRRLRRDGVDLGDWK